MLQKKQIFLKENLKELLQGKHFLFPLFRALRLWKDVQQLLSCQVLHNLLWSGALQMPLQNSLKKQIPAWVNQRCKLKGAYKSQHTFITPFICEQYLRASLLTSWGEQLCGQICISCQENMIYPKTLQHRKLRLSPRWLFYPHPYYLWQKGIFRSAWQANYLSISWLMCPAVITVQLDRLSQAWNQELIFYHEPSCPASSSVSVRIHPGVQTNFSGEGLPWVLHLHCPLSLVFGWI